MYKISILGCAIQHRKYKQCFMINLNGIYSIKIELLCGKPETNIINKLYSILKIIKKKGKHRHTMEYYLAF